MAIELYWGSGSPFAWRALLALEWKKIPYTSKMITFSKGEHKAPGYIAMNPRGKVPVLRDGEVTLYETLAVVNYLEKRQPEPALFGRTPAEAGAIWREISECIYYFEQPAFAVIAPIFFGGVSEKAEAMKAGAASLHGGTRPNREDPRERELARGRQALGRRHLVVSRDHAGRARGWQCRGAAAQPRSRLNREALPRRRALAEADRGAARLRAHLSASLEEGGVGRARPARATSSWRRAWRLLESRPTCRGRRSRGRNRRLRRLAHAKIFECSAANPGFAISDGRRASSIFRQSTAGAIPWPLRAGPNGALVTFICNHCPYVKAVLDRIVRDCAELAQHGIGSVAIMSNDPADYRRIHSRT